MRSDGKLYFSVKERGKIRKDNMKLIMNKLIDRDHDVEGDSVEGSVVCE